MIQALRDTHIRLYDDKSNEIPRDDFDVLSFSRGNQNF